jgi:tRNA dimethylallyltransferase
MRKRPDRALRVPPLVIVGATATGKSALALALAERLPGGGEIVNADALQVYRGFDVGTAKPSAAERQRVPHHLIDVLEPAERYSAGEFARRAREAIHGIGGRARWPIVAGGSGLYLRALLAGISPIPVAGERAREVGLELRRRAAAEGLGPLAAELARLDPETAARLRPGDSQRVLRALQVALVSGRPLSRWIAEQPFGTQSIAAIRVGLTLPRAILYDRIAGRVTRMLQGGWAEEVRELLESGLAPDLPAFQAIGYRQLVHYVRGDWSLERAIDDTVRATRRFAKRQETWFRREPDVTWFSAEDLDRRIPQVLEHVERALGESPA